VFLEDAAGHTTCNHRVLNVKHANVTYESKATFSTDPSSPEMLISPYHLSQCEKEGGKRIQEGTSTERIRVNYAQIRGRGNCNLRYKRTTLFWNIKYCHYYINFIKSRNLSSASLQESLERCVASSRNWEWTTLKQPSEHNCAKRKDKKGIFPTEWHWWRKTETTYHSLIHYVFKKKSITTS
jgi:hypothetical protein